MGVHHPAHVSRLDIVRTTHTVYVYIELQFASAVRFGWVVFPYERHVPPMSPSLPDEWHEVKDPDYIVEKYRARNPTLFVRADHDVGVHVLPVATSSPHDEEGYRAGAIRGDCDEFGREIPIGMFDEQDPAFERACSFATLYEQAYGDGTDVDDAVRCAIEACT